MAETSWPYTDTATSDIEWSRLARELQDPGVVDVIGGSQLAITADGSGMGVSLSPGLAFLRGYFYRNDGAKTLTVGAASANPRIDRVVLRLDISAITPAARIVAAIKAGTPAASGAVPPSLQQEDTGIYEIPLARIPVAVGQTSIPPLGVVNERSVIGNLVGQWTTDLRPTSPKKYKMGFNETTGLTEYWSGAAWKNLGDTIRINEVKNPDGWHLLDGRKVLMGPGPAAPSNSLGANNDIFVSYTP